MAASENPYEIHTCLAEVMVDHMNKWMQFRVLGSEKTITHTFDKIKVDFQKTVESVRSAAEDGRLDSLKDMQKLAIYAWFKQATLGNNEAETPSVFNPKARAKHLAWLSVRNNTRVQAMVEYILVAVKLKLA